MSREKKITLFSRNLVKIEKITGIDFGKWRELPYSLSVSHATTYENNAPTVWHYKQGGYREVKKESRLGFYYTKTEYYSGRYIGASDNNKGLTITKLTINLGTEQYILSYPSDYNGMHIGIEARPWDIAPGSKGMETHFITDLLNEATKFFDIIFDYKIETATERYNIKADKINANELKKKTFIDLFGYADGPKTQPNDVKILSHGFDLKESFRKRKEE